MTEIGKNRLTGKDTIFILQWNIYRDFCPFNYRVCVQIHCSYLKHIFLCRLPKPPDICLLSSTFLGRFPEEIHSTLLMDWQRAVLELPILPIYIKVPVSSLVGYLLEICYNWGSSYARHVRIWLRGEKRHKVHVEEVCQQNMKVLEKKTLALYAW